MWTAFGLQPHRSQTFKLSSDPLRRPDFGFRQALLPQSSAGTRPVTVEARAGLVLPLLTSATGQVFLAWLPEIVWKHTADLERRSLGSFDVQGLRNAVLKLGIGVTRGDLLPRIAAVSCPVFDHQGNLVCALTTLGLLGEIDVDTSGQTARQLHHCAAELSKVFGFAGVFPQLA